MLKSLYSGVTGMRSQQTKMDVISNNIANVSTTGFKSGRVRFQDLISQIDAPAQGASNNRGGVNAQQIGLGVQVSGTDTIMTSGSLQTTGRALDFGIQNGDNSFFIVGGPEDGSGELQYTRDGGFFTDTEGSLVTASGMRVLGYKPTDDASKFKPVFIDDDFKGFPKPDDDGNVNFTQETFSGVEIPNKITVPKIKSDGTEDTTTETVDLQSFNIDNSGTIIGTYSNGQSYALGRVALANFVNPDGLEKAGGNLYNRTDNSGTPLRGAAGEDGYGQIRSGFLEMSNVDLANEFTEMIVTSRAYQANSRSITTSDEMIQELLSLKR